jgi:hypothetical protein
MGQNVPHGMAAQLCLGIFSAHVAIQRAHSIYVPRRTITIPHRKTDTSGACAAPALQTASPMLWRAEISQRISNKANAMTPLPAESMSFGRRRDSKTARGNPRTSDIQAIKMHRGHAICQLQIRNVHRARFVRRRALFPTVRLLSGLVCRASDRRNQYRSSCRNSLQVPM